MNHTLLSIPEDELKTRAANYEEESDSQATLELTPTVRRKRKERRTFRVEERPPSPPNESEQPPLPDFQGENALPEMPTGDSESS